MHKGERMKVLDLKLATTQVSKDRMGWYFELENNIGEYDKLRVEVFYSLGGSNYFTGGVMPRGYYVSVTPVNYNDGVETYELFSATAGKKIFIQGATRFNRNALLKMEAAAEEAVVPLVEELLNLSTVA